jgi:sugar phosphate permease
MQLESDVRNAELALGATRQRVVLAVILMITLLVAYLDRVNVSVLVADNNFLTEMGIKGNPVQMGMLMTLFLIAYGVANVVLSPLGDIIGTRKAMLISIFLWTISVMIGGLTATFGVMLCARAVLGVGEGMHWPMQSAFVKNWFPPGERGKANGAWLLGLMVGPAVAMPFFTWIISTWGWRPSFFVLASMGLVPLFLLYFFVTDHPRQHKGVNKAELDYIENALRTEAVQEATMKVEKFGERLASFCFNYRFWLLTINYFCIASIWWGTMAWLPSYLKASRGFSWAAMGALSSLPYVLGAISILFFGHLGDKIGRRAPLAAVSHALAAAGIYFGANATDNMTAALLISFGIASIAIALPASWSLLQRVVPAGAIGAGSGMMNGLANGSSAFAPALIGYFIAITGGYIGGLMFLVGLGALGFVCMFILSLQKY